MFQNFKIVSSQADAQTRFSSSKDWKFASDLVMTPVTSKEIPTLASEYAVVFSGEDTLFPVALFGLEGKNLYVSPEGAWSAQNIPSRMRIAPFGTIVQDGKAHIVRDVDAPHFQDPAGELLYSAEGKEMPIMNRVTLMAAEMHLGLVDAAQRTKEVADAGLLVDATVTLTWPDGSQRNIAGFKAVNEAALAALDAKSRKALEESGALAMLEAHQQSLINLGRLTADAPAADEQPKAAAKKRSSAAAKPAAETAKAAKPAAETAKASKTAGTAKAPAKAAKPAAETKAASSVTKSVAATAVKKAAKPAAKAETAPAPKRTAKKAG